MQHFRGCTLKKKVGISAAFIIKMAACKRGTQGTTTETMVIPSSSSQDSAQNCKKESLSTVLGRVRDGTAVQLPWKPTDAIKLAICLGSGAIFGFAAEKSKVYVPSVIQNQMVFSQFTMLKMFLSAVTAGIGSFSLLCLLPQTGKLFNKVRADFASGVTSKKTIAFAVGGVILGMGMTLSGACPGMVTIQVASGVPNALFTLAGCFTGAVLYAVLQEPLRSLLFNKRPKPPPSVWLDRRYGYSFLSLSLPLAAGLLAIVLATEYFVPWTSEVPVSTSDVELFSQLSWSPILAGGVIGLLQLPVAVAVSSSMGGSSSYCTLLSQSSTVRARLGYFNNYHTGIENWWQVVYWVGAMLGAMASLYLTGQGGQQTVDGVSPGLAFLGGVLVLVGARTASGCTSGHGLSGMALLSASSFIAVPAMFAGAMGLAFFMQ